MKKIIICFSIFLVAATGIYFKFYEQLDFDITKIIKLEEITKIKQTLFGEKKNETPQKSSTETIANETKVDTPQEAEAPIIDILAEDISLPTTSDSGAETEAETETKKDTPKEETTIEEHQKAIETPKTEAESETETDVENSKGNIIAEDEPKSETLETKTENSEDYLSSYVNEEINKAESRKEATHQARELLAHKPTILTPNPQLTAEKNMAKAKENSHGITLEKPAENVPATKPEAPVKTPEEIAREKKSLIMQTHSDAPLGLYWGINKEQTQTLGFQLKNASREDYTEVYQILNPQQKNNVFSLVSAIYGNIDKLWCIYAESYQMDDTANASKVLELYQIYYQALNQKYGNAQQHYTPYTYEEITEEMQNGEIKQVKQQKKSSIGGANFLSEIQSGKSSLYATFNNQRYGITLGIAVNKSGKSYFYIDYKDLVLMKQNKDSVQNNILSDI